MFVNLWAHERPLMGTDGARKKCEMYWRGNER